MASKSKWWANFSKIDGKSAKCKTCGRIIKTSGNTSNLRAHILKLHPKLVETSPKKLSVALREPRKEEMQNTIDSFIDQPSTSQCTITLKRNIQSTLEESLEVITTHQEGGKRHCLITNAVAQLLCKADLPFSIVENEAFLKLFKIMAPHYKVPCRKTIKKLIFDKYNVASNIYKNKFRQLQSFSITADMWTETLQTRSFLGITVHFLNDKKLNSVTLGVFETEESHTADYIATRMQSILQEWELNKEKLSSVVTDGAANMIKAIDIAFGKEKHIVCLAHIINLVACQSIEAVSELIPILDKVKKVVRWFKLSVKASDELRAQSNLKLKQSVETRWNSTYEMVERFLSLSPTINNILHRHTSAPGMTTAAENRDLREVIQLLEPLVKATEQLSGDKYPTISLAIPICWMIENKVAKMAPSSSIGTKLKGAILEQIKKRLVVERNILLAVSSLLDPRWKKLYFKDPESVVKAIEEVKSLMKSTSSPKGGQSSDSDYGEDAESSFFGEHAKIVQQTWKGRKSSGSSNLPDELALYLRSPAEADINKCPLSFWCNSGLYPELSEVAKRYLAANATSVPSERLFSKAGNIVNTNRNRLKGETLNKLVFLHSLGEEFFF